MTRDASARSRPPKGKAANIRLQWQGDLGGNAHDPGEGALVPKASSLVVAIVAGPRKRVVRRGG